MNVDKGLDEINFRRGKRRQRQRQPQLSSEMRQRLGPRPDMQRSQLVKSDLRNRLSGKSKFAAFRFDVLNNVIVNEAVLHEKWVLEDNLPLNCLGISRSVMWS